MKNEELEIEIDAAGRVRVLTKGIKGKACLDYVELFNQLLGPVQSQELTPEYNQVQNQVDTQNQAKVHRRIEF